MARFTIDLDERFASCFRNDARNKGISPNVYLELYVKGHLLDDDDVDGFAERGCMVTEGCNLAALAKLSNK